MKRTTIGAWAGAMAAVILIVVIVQKQHAAAANYEHDRRIWCNSTALTPPQKASCPDEGPQRGDYLPWGYVLVAWPEGIAAWGLLLTLGAIVWQAVETRRSAQAAAKAVAAANRQTNMTRDKERARIEIKADGLELHDDPSLWQLEGTLKIRNLGLSRAYIIRFQAEIVWCESESEEPPPDLSIHMNQLPDEFLDPTRKNSPPEQVPVWFWDTRSMALDWFASGVYSGDIRIVTWVFIEYSTVGTTYTRLLKFEWKASGRQGGLSYAVLASDPPSDNKKRVSAGWWTLVANEESVIEESGEKRGPN